MTRRTVWTTAFLSITGAAVGMELYAALDASSDTDPWTFLIVDHLPAGVTFAAIALLTAWLGPHFAAAYRRRRGETMTQPVPPVPDPATRPATEPLTARSFVVAGAAIVAAAVAFGLPLTDAQQAATIGAIAALAPVVMALWGRRHVWSPAQVVRAVARERADCHAKFEQERTQTRNMHTRP